MSDFKFKPFEEMTPEDYASVGFKSGLEVHQQLLTEKKLFCRCPAGRYNNSVYHAEILRHMRPTLSELGEYDGTALMEFKTKKDIIYRIHYDTVCTYEMDDTPPFEVNESALDIAFEIGMLYNSSIVDEVHIARKQYLDGSIPTGFQRTAITSVGGSVPFKDRQIGIIQMSIEEDSCREYSDIGHRRVYLTDRLGMPLIETVTEPDMRTPNEVAEVCELLRRLVRSTGKVRTGIGAGRQDVNVSVTGGTRIEIKGVSRIPLIPILTYNESMRQWNLLRLKDELNSRGIDENTFSAEFFDVTKAMSKTAYAPIHDSVQIGKRVNCVVLRGFKGLLRWQTQTDTYFSREISDRVRVIACLTTLPNIVHSDSPSDTLASGDWSKLRKLTNAKEEDTLVVVWGDDNDVETGAKEVIIRAKEATIGIPSETRQALKDGTNGFERILPGPERMYPDTDLPPKRITQERLDNIRKGLPKYFWNREAWYKQIGVQADVISDLAVSKYAALFEKAVEDLKIEPKVAARALIIYPKKLKKLGYDINNLNTEIMELILTDYHNNRILKDGIYEAMKIFAAGEEYSKDKLPQIASESEFIIEAKQAQKKYEKMIIAKDDSKFGLMMSLVMGNLRGRTNGCDAANYVKDVFAKENE